MVNAIKNGKYDIREGHPFPENKLEELNNLPDSFSKNEEGGKNTERKDKNDASNLKEKFEEDKIKKEINNKGIISSYATNDIAKQGR